MMMAAKCWTVKGSLMVLICLVSMLTLCLPPSAMAARVDPFSTTKAAANALQNIILLRPYWTWTPYPHITWIPVYDTSTPPPTPFASPSPSPISSPRPTLTPTSAPLSSPPEPARRPAHSESPLSPHSPKLSPIAKSGGSDSPPQTSGSQSHPPGKSPEDSPPPDSASPKQHSGPLADAPTADQHSLLHAPAAHGN